MLSNVDILTKEVLERLQAASYHILDRVGARVPLTAILERLAKAGATADAGRQGDRLPQLLMHAVGGGLSRQGTHTFRREAIPPGTVCAIRPAQALPEIDAAAALEDVEALDSKVISQGPRLGPR